ncbi:hypothetical protein KY346_02960 [Candidatus Woesearchaeota archaeon]|nr:hypothetical protein [Candidatus Woesearchaeota archaeon]
MERRKTIIVLLLLLLLIVILALVFTLLVKKPAYKVVFEENYDICIGERGEVYYTVLAEKTGDIGYCNKLKGEAKIYCAANVNRDPSVCQDLSEDAKKRCIAGITKDSSLCRPDNYMCLAYTTGDQSYCLKSSDTQKIIDDCIAMATRNADYFLNNQVKQECADSSYMIAAQEFNHKPLCDNIVDAQLKQRCIKLII